MTRTFLLALAATCGVATVLARGPVKLDPDLPYQGRAAHPASYKVDYLVLVTPPAKTKLLRVWLPVAPTEPGQKADRGTLSTFPVKVEPTVGTEPVFGNTFAYFEFANPVGAQAIRHQFEATVSELRWDIDPAKVERVEKWPADFDRYLKSDKAVVVDERFERKVRGIVAERRGPADDLAAVMDWLHANMKYDHGRASLAASSEFALENQGGHCSDYHGLCAAFGRVLGTPTRVTYGLAMYLKDSPSHCKVEAYLPPYGWVSFDVADTQKLVKAIEADRELTAEKKAALVRAAFDRLRRGFRDNMWLRQTRGTDYDLVPKASRRVNIVRTIYAEADGVPLPEPDPADANKREFAWMTAVEVKPDRPVTYPFKDWSSLAPR